VPETDKLTSKDGPAEDKQSNNFMDKMQKRYVNVKKVIETERGVDSEIVAAKASNNPYEGFRNKQQQKPQKRLIDRHLVNEVIKNE